MSTAVNIGVRGGDAFKEKLLGMAKGLERAKAVRVGFLADATYPAGENAARLASAAKRAQKEGRTGWARLLSSWAAWAQRNQRTLKVAQVAFWDEFGTARSKARPFFRSMIRSKSPRWAYWLGRFLKGSDYDAEVALTKLGMKITGELQDSIESWPADNAPLTQFIKGFNKGLDDRGVMKDSVDFEVH